MSKNNIHFHCRCIHLEGTSKAVGTGQRVEGNIHDIYDGEGYKCFSEFLSNPAHISLLINTDGVSLYRSSSVSIWPVWGVVNELPASMRYIMFLKVVCERKLRLSPYNVYTSTSHKFIMEFLCSDFIQACIVI